MLRKLPWRWVGCGQSLRFGKSILDLRSFSAEGASVNLSHLSYTPKRGAFIRVHLTLNKTKALRTEPSGVSELSQARKAATKIRVLTRWLKSEQLV